MTSLILAAVLAQADGGSDAAVADASIYSLCPERGTVVAVDGGVLISDQQGRRLNCIMDACDFRVRELEKTITAAPATYKTVAVVLGVAAGGFIAGMVCARVKGCLPF